MVILVPNQKTNHIEKSIFILAQKFNILIFLSNIGINFSFKNPKLVGHSLHSLRLYKKVAIRCQTIRSRHPRDRAENVQILQGETQNEIQFMVGFYFHFLEGMFTKSHGQLCIIQCAFKMH